MRFLSNFFLVVSTVILVGCAGVGLDLKIQASDGANPWTHLNLYNNPDNFQFAIVSDRTGGHRPGVFADAVEKLNLLKPEFVVSIGDSIEGYTHDEAEIARQWDEFDILVNRLQMPFFYVPGNHDISNTTMAKKWQERLGSSYYHFVYRDVLFLCLNTQDGSSRWIDDQQMRHFQKVLKENRNVRWTLVFMHQPMWFSGSSENWQQFESLLEDRPYTVFAGHVHTYNKSVQEGRMYYLLATTGGAGKGQAGKPTGLAECQFDHIVWITMTDDGPLMANLLLEGILDDEPCPDP
ncbi:MAG: metallophosphoesterase family protein [Planctomycetota bacterium]|jgi:predicted phosphodiesterase